MSVETGESGRQAGNSTAMKVSRAAFLLLVFSLPFMKHNLPVGGLAVTATDFLFLLSAGALAVAIGRGEARLRWNAFYATLLIYFAAMLASAIAAEEQARAWLKLASQAYLLSLPLLGATLIDSMDDLRAVFRTWLAATAITVAIGTLTVLLFTIGIDQPLSGYALHEFGTLPPGDYPRIEATFDYPAMLCNFLTVSLMILFASRYLGWIGQAPFLALLAAILITAIFSLTPGLGGVFLALGIWVWLVSRDHAAWLALAAGGAAATAFLLAAAVTPFLHPTAPFLIDLPGLERQFAPSARMLTWIDSAQRFFEQPLLGHGIGSDAAAVHYVAPSGSHHDLTDAHNVFLNFAAQCGLVGLAAMTLLVGSVARKTSPLRIERRHLLRLALGSAWLNAFVYQGLTGSYEDARHLWVLLGLLLAADRLTLSERNEPKNRHSPLANGAEESDAGRFEERYERL